MEEVLLDELGAAEAKDVWVDSPLSERRSEPIGAILGLAQVSRPSDLAQPAVVTDQEALEGRATH